MKVRVIKSFPLFLLFMLYASDTLSAEQFDNHLNGDRLGLISVTGVDSVDDATRSLSKKADELGGGKFRVISLGGNNKLFAVAEVFK
ncbi:DUF1471 domain-containing protein [Rosenbergiella epipactidis]|uniref:DUF1471 domain-containing protein n=1 Tax=Rosenbergiella epipactidis TaxID=1544694 RepID=UPI001F4DABFF|nr:DUF1471 domain-containing protein [Rosenbergiella epipactidis]